MIYLLNTNKLGPNEAIILLGVIIGVISVASPGSLLTFSVFASVLFLMNRFLKMPEKRFLLVTFISGFAMRIFLLLLINLFSVILKKWFYYPSINQWMVSFFGDGAFSAVRSGLLGKFFGGGNLNDLEAIATFSEYGMSGYLYLMGLFHYLAGYSPFSVTSINCLLSALTGTVYYFIAKELFNEKAGRITAILVTFFPSLIFWSLFNLKDSLYIFNTGIMLWGGLIFLSTGKINYLFLTVLAIYVQSTLRAKFAVATIAIFIILYLICKLKIRRVYTILIISSLALFLFKLKDKLRPIIESRIIDPLKTVLIGYHRGVINTEGVVYRLYPDWIYSYRIDATLMPTKDFIIAGLKGWVHFFLEPFPWNVYSFSALTAYPQIIILYLLLPFSILGVLFALATNWRKSVFLLGYFLFIGSFFALSGGNIGTDFRTRDSLTPIILLYSAIGITNIFFPKQRELQE